MHNKTNIPAGSNISWTKAGDNKQLITKDLLHPARLIPVGITDPVDNVEGKGKTIEPQSLFVKQKSERLG